MARTHMVIITCHHKENIVETRHLVNVNSSRTAALYALHKSCPDGEIDASTPGVFGLSAKLGDLHFKVNAVKPVKAKDVLTLSCYYPVHVPSAHFTQMAAVA